MGRVCPILKWSVWTCESEKTVSPRKSQIFAHFFGAIISSYYTPTSGACSTEISQFRQQPWRRFFMLNFTERAAHSNALAFDIPIFFCSLTELVSASQPLCNWSAQQFLSLALRRANFHEDGFRSRIAQEEVQNGVLEKSGFRRSSSEFVSFLYISYIQLYIYIYVIVFYSCSVPLFSKLGVLMLLMLKSKIERRSQTFSSRHEMSKLSFSFRWQLEGIKNINKPKADVFLGGLVCLITASSLPHLKNVSSKFVPYQDGTFQD